MVLRKGGRPDQRKRISDISSLPYSAIGLLCVQFPLKNGYKTGYGTAFLVGHNIVITAAHNIFNIRDGVAVNFADFTLGIEGQKAVTKQTAFALIPKSYKNSQGY